MLDQHHLEQHHRVDAGASISHLRGHVSDVAHGSKSFLAERSFDDARDRQLRGHQLHRLGLQGVRIIEHIHLHLWLRLIDTPRPARRLPQCKEVIAHRVEDDGGEGIEVETGLHAARICDEDLQAVPDALIHPLLALLRGDLRREDLCAVAVFLQQL